MQRPDPLDQLPELLAVSGRLSAVRYLRALVGRKHCCDTPLSTIENHLHNQFRDRAFDIARQIREQRRSTWPAALGMSPTPPQRKH